MKIINILLTFLLFPLLIFAQIPGEWIETEANIVEIERKISRRSYKGIATIDYTLANETAVTSTVDILIVPFVDFHSAGDTITVLYNSENPAIVKTKIGRIIDQYGMYLLILLGIIFSIKPFLKNYSKGSQ